MKMTDGEKVYIQERDAQVVMSVMPEDSIPQVIVDIYNSKDSSSFVELKDSKEREFINSLDYLIDYNTLRYLSLTETLAMNQSTLVELNRAFRLYAEALELSDEESIKRAKVRLELMKYREECIKEMISSKRGPIVITSNKSEPKKKMRVFNFRSNKGRE